MRALLLNAALGHQPAQPQLSPGCQRLLSRLQPSAGANLQQQCMLACSAPSR